MAVNVLDATGATVSVETLPSVARKAASASLPVVLSTEDLAALTAITTQLALPQAVTGTFFQATQPVSIAAAVSVNSTPVASEIHVGQVGGYTANPTASITRPADTTAYASGDLVANSTTAGSVAYGTLTVARKNNGPFSISRLRLRKSSVGITNTSFRVHLFRSAPTFANGDNAAFSTNGVANYLGYLDVAMDYAFTDGAIGQAGFTTQPTILLAGGVSTISWALEARAAYTPVSAETFTLELEVVQG